MTSMEALSAQLARARFEAALDTHFELELPGQALSLQLFEVTARPAPAGYEQYSALFRGPATPVLAQATYVLRHPAFGDLPLFIVPVAHDAATVVYEACVVRRIDNPGDSRP